MDRFFLDIGEQVSFSKTVAESDVYLFAGVTGDFNANHTNEEIMRASQYGHRLVHGALIVGFMSTASTQMIMTARESASELPVSLGYDGVRFLHPVFIGDTITVTYRIASVDASRRRALGEIEVHNQNGVLTAVGKHILKWVPNHV